METIVLFDVGVGSFNLGDSIIMESAEKGLKDILDNNFVLHFPTHTPIVTAYQNNNFNPGMEVFNNASHKFICGSNLLWNNLFCPRPSLNINFFNYLPYKDSIMMGVGFKPLKKHVNLYTKILYKKILSDSYIHSVRDDAAKEFLESLGFKAINTGCPTMWQFTTEFCSEIPTVKANSVVFTLTDYNKDNEKDQMLIDILLKNYENVYFWVQGTGDLEYFKKMRNINTIQIIPASVQQYSKILSEEDIDYVGTRLHAGMFAMQHKRRSIILSVDNRVRDMERTYSINSLERDSIDQLQDFIKSEFQTNININNENINIFLSQFKIN